MIDLNAEFKALEGYGESARVAARNRIREAFARIPTMEAEITTLEGEIRRLAEAGAKARVRIAELEAVAAVPMPIVPAPMPQYGVDDFPHRPWTTASSLPLAQDDPPIAWDDEEFPGEGWRNAQFVD